MKDISQLFAVRRYIIILAIVSPLFVQGQVIFDNCHAIEDSLSNHIICNLNSINGFSSVMREEITANGPSPLCDQGGTASNISWFGFIAGTGDYNIEIIPSNCIAGTTGLSGMQAGAYTSCSWDEAVWCDPFCNDAGLVSPDSIFIPGNTYYVFLDGCQGAICEYQINIIGNFVPFGALPNTGIENTGTSCEPFPLCTGADLTIELLEFDSLFLEYEWILDLPDTTARDTVYTDDHVLNYEFDREGIYNVCVTVGNGCSTLTACDEYTFVTLEPEVFPSVELCVGEFWFGPPDSLDMNGDGLGWQGGFIIANDTDGTFDGVLDAETLEETECGCPYLQQVEITILPDSEINSVTAQVCQESYPFVFNGSIFLGPVSDVLFEFPGAAANGCDSALLFTLVEIDCIVDCPEVDLNTIDCDSIETVPHIILDDYPANLSQGDNFCLPVRVRDFNYMSSFQFTFSFNPYVIRYSDVIKEGSAFPGANALLNLTQTNFGNLSYLWFSNTGEGVCLADSAIIVTLCFEVVGDPLDITPITLSDNITEINAGISFDISIPTCETGLEFTQGNLEVACPSLLLQSNICYDEVSRSIVSLFACGGQPPYRIEIGGDTIIAEDNSDMVMFEDLLPGPYTISVTDSLGAFFNDSIVIILGDPVAFTLSVNAPSCTDSDDGSISINSIDGMPFEPFGDVQIEWSNGVFNQSSIDDLTNGEYLFKITNADGCVSVDTVRFDSQEIETFVEIDSVCAGSGFSIVVGNDLYNEVNPSGVTVVSSESGCDSTVNVNITYIGAINNIEESFCLNQGIVINGTTYNVDNPSGQETLEGASVSGCDSVIIIDLDFIDFTLIEFDTTVCSGGSATLGGANLDEDNLSDTLILVNNTGMGCDTMITYSLLFFPNDTTFVNDTLCLEEILIVNETEYSQFNPIGEELIENGSVNGCDSMVSVNLSFYEVSFASIDTSLCSGLSVLVGDMIFTESVVDEVVVIPGGSSNGCDSIINIVEIAFSPEIVVTLLENNPDDGSGAGSLSVEVTGGLGSLEIAWSNGELNTTEITNLESGDYSIAVRDELGCIVTVIYTVDFFSATSQLESLGIAIYPNPFTSHFSIVKDKSSQPYQLSLFNAQGIRVAERVLDRQETELELGRDLEQGIYFYRISSNDKFVTQGKIIKQD
jgi:hypothetical protein